MDNNALTIIYWVLKGLVGIFMGLAGVSKFFGEEWIQKFEAWGFSASFCYLIGGIEIVGVILLLIPKTTQYAKLLLSIVMLGAIGTLIANQDNHQLISPLVYLVFLIVLALINQNLAKKQAWLIPKKLP